MSHRNLTDGCRYARIMTPEQLEQLAEVDRISKNIIICTNPDRDVAERFPGIKICIATNLYYGTHSHILDVSLMRDEMHGCHYKKAFDKKYFEEEQK